MRKNVDAKEKDNYKKTSCVSTWCVLLAMLMKLLIDIHMKCLPGFFHLWQTLKWLAQLTCFWHEALPYIRLTDKLDEMAT